MEHAKQIIIQQKEQKQKAIVPRIRKRYTVKKGQFGLYVTDGTANVSLPKGTHVEALDVKACAEIIK